MKPVALVFWGTVWELLWFPLYPIVPGFDFTEEMIGAGKMAELGEARQSCCRWYWRLTKAFYLRFGPYMTWLFFLNFSVLGTAGELFYVWALTGMGAAVANTIYMSYVLFAALFAWMFLKSEKMTLFKAAMILLCVGGVVMVCYNELLMEEGEGEEAHKDAPGLSEHHSWAVILVVVTAFLEGIEAVYAKYIDDNDNMERIDTLRTLSKSKRSSGSTRTPSPRPNQTTSPRSTRTPSPRPNQTTSPRFALPAGPRTNRRPSLETYESTDPYGSDLEDPAEARERPTRDAYSPRGRDYISTSPFTRSRRAQALAWWARAKQHYGGHVWSADMGERSHPEQPAEVTESPPPVDSTTEVWMTVDSISASAARDDRARRRPHDPTPASMLAPPPSRRAFAKRARRGTTTEDMVAWMKSQLRTPANQTPGRRRNPRSPKRREGSGEESTSEGRAIRAASFSSSEDPFRTSCEAFQDAWMFSSAYTIQSVAIVWIPVVLCHYTGLEPFEVPTMEQIPHLLAYCTFGDVIELIEVYGLFVSTATLMSAGSVLVIPMSYIVSIITGSLVPTLPRDWMLIVGSVISFVGVLFVEWNPFTQLCDCCAGGEEGSGSSHDHGDQEEADDCKEEATD